MHPNQSIPAAGAERPRGKRPCRALRAALRPALAAAGLLTATLQATEPTQTGAVGPRRIVSLGPSVTKQLYRLGAAGEVVGSTTYCPPPPEGREITRIGSVVDPGIEPIVRLRPDLVLATPLSNRRRLETLRTLRIPVVEIGSPKTFEEICAQFLDLSQRVGRAGRGAEIVAQATGRLEALRRNQAGAKRPSVFLQIGARPLSTAGGGNFLDDMITRAGGVNIAGDAERVAYSREAVLAADPDCILIVTMGMTGPDEKRKWERYETLKAVAAGRVHMLDSELFCSPTPESFVEGVAQMAALLHPEGDFSGCPSPLSQALSRALSITVPTKLATKLATKGPLRGVFGQVRAPEGSG